MSGSIIEHRPKGGLCMACVKCEGDCSKLPFETMPLIGTYEVPEHDVTVRVVRCTEFARAAR